MLNKMFKKIKEAFKKESQKPNSPMLKAIAKTEAEVTKAILENLPSAKKTVDAAKVSVKKAAKSVEQEIIAVKKASKKPPAKKKKQS